MIGFVGLAFLAGLVKNKWHDERARLPGELDIRSALSEANLLKMIWEHIRKRLSMVSRTRMSTRPGPAKIGLHRACKKREIRSCPPILYLDGRIVNIEALYQSTDEATSLTPVNGITHPRCTITMACRDLYTFEFEFEFRRHGPEFGDKTN